MWATAPIVLATLWLFVGIAAAQLVPAAPDSRPTTGSVAQQALRQRATEFYTLLQRQQLTQAEAFCTKESRERLRPQVQGTFLSFRVVSMDIAPDQGSATVVIELTQMLAFAGATFPIQRDTQWVMEDGEWHVVVPAPRESTLEDMMAMGGQNSPKPAELVFKGNEYRLGLMKQGERKQARFPFTNTTDHAVTIAQVETGCKCLAVKTTKMEYKAGESGELLIEFDSTDYEYEFTQSVMVKTNPGGAKSYVHIVADVLPPSKVPKDNGATAAPQR